jgi:hypothetical protein
VSADHAPHCSCYQDHKLAMPDADYFAQVAFAGRPLRSRFHLNYLQNRAFHHVNATGRDGLATEPRDRHETGTCPVLDERMHQYYCLPIYFAGGSGNRPSSARTDASTLIRPFETPASICQNLTRYPASQGAQLRGEVRNQIAGLAQRSVGATRYDRNSHRGSRTNLVNQSGAAPN